MERPRTRAARAASLLALALVASSAATGCAGASSSPSTAADCANVASAQPSPSAGPPWPQALDHASTPETHRAAVDGLFEAMHLQQVLDIALDNAIKVQLEANPKIRQFEGVMRRFMGKYLSLKGVREPLTRLYVERFSELELVQLAAFYRTPLGERTLSELPKLLEEGGKIGLSLVQEHMDELKSMIRDEMMRSGGAP